MPYDIIEVSGEKRADDIRRINGLFSAEFTELKPKHLERGFWWLVLMDGEIVGFAGMTPFDPFPRTGYLKRGAILPAHRGHGLQGRLMELREAKAKSATDWTHLVSECSNDNVASANNFIRAGYRMVEAERPWAENTLFWMKKL